MSKNKVIDYLSEDPVLPSQKYALISIVGPNTAQKCDVWGLKIKGVTDSFEEAKNLTKKLMKFDNNFDIYTVSVGKFFPLAIEPYDIPNVEFENEQLNNLVKSYLENKENADEHWHKRKSEMMKEAIREGKKEGQEELANKQEHPVVVLQRIQSYKSDMQTLNDKLSELTEKLELSQTKYNSYTEEEKEFANTKLQKTDNKLQITEPTDKEVVPGVMQASDSNYMINNYKSEMPVEAFI